MNSKFSVTISFVVLLPVYIVLFMYFDPAISRQAVDLARSSGYSLSDLQFFSDTSSHVVTYALVFIFFWLAVLSGGRVSSGSWQGKAMYIAAALAVAICLESLLKYCFGRYRPEELYNQLYGFNWLQGTVFSRESTPSGHSTRAFALAISVARVAGKRWISMLLVLYAIFIAASRVFLGDHYVSDVLFGAWVGYSSAVLLQPFFLCCGSAGDIKD